MASKLDLNFELSWRSSWEASWGDVGRFFGGIWRPRCAQDGPSWPKMALKMMLKMVSKSMWEDFPKS